MPDAKQAVAFSERLTLDIARRIPSIGRLGDDCDFLTVAVDCPFRYLGPDRGVLAMDDLLGRVPEGPERWAYAGRLPGDQARPPMPRCAACSSSPNRPSSSTPTTTTTPTPAGPITTRAPAAARLKDFSPIALRRAEGADLAGWHRATHPINRAGLIFLNSSGGPEDFNLRSGPAGQTGDVPPSVPTVVLPIHSYSAADPADAATIAAAG